MKLNELIKQLIELKAKYGNLDVVMDDGCLLENIEYSKHISNFDNCRSVEVIYLLQGEDTL